jgi:hypothetical protein
VSTARILALSGEEGAASLDSTVRLLELSGSDAGVLAASITGITEAQAGQPIVLTAVVTGGSPTGYTWTQTAGPTLTPTREGDTYEALAPAALLGTTVTLQVTVDPGGSTDTHTITVHGATRLRLAPGGEWVPVVRYRLNA